MCLIVCRNPDGCGKAGRPDREDATVPARIPDRWHMMGFSSVAAGGQMMEETVSGRPSDGRSGTGSHQAEQESASFPGFPFCLFARSALLPDGWAGNVRVEVAADGRIASVGVDASRMPGDLDLGTQILLPALCNLHSHAFQRAMAGRTGHRSGEQDDFWSWRAWMHRFVDRLGPEQMQAIAMLAYVEMLEAGYAAVGEFHYLHHQAGGAAYASPAEMSGRIFAAASATGIGLTHLPVLYSRAGADGAPLAGGSLRFGCDLERYGGLLEGVQAAIRALGDDARTGIALHSLRAVAPEDMLRAVALLPEGPVHIHASEQMREVEEIQAWLGGRPVEILLGDVGLDPRWCVVHATHMNESETTGLAASGAVAGLCPITEADLGDGAFSGRAFLSAGGRFGIGTDSNVCVSAAGELRQLEYSQRQALHARNVLAPATGSLGESIYRKALAGGAQALGRDSGIIGAGAFADLVAIDGTDSALAGLENADILDGWLFAAGRPLVRNLWSAGRHVVRDGRHAAREFAERGYQAALQTVLERT